MLVALPLSLVAILIGSLQGRVEVCQLVSRPRSAGEVASPSSWRLFLHTTRCLVLM